MRLGKREYRFDERTLKLGTFLAPPPELKIPLTHDFDKGRSKVPLSMLGNDNWGNCVMVGRANHALRLERVERRSTPVIETADVVSEYQAECLRQFGNAPKTAGDPYDGGLYVIEAIKDWRGDGWQIKLTKTAKETGKQSIAAYGEIDKTQTAQTRAAMFLLHGVQMGLSLPTTASQQLSSGKWDVVPGDAHSTQPGSWGGHCVYCKRYDEGGIYCLTWGREIYMTNAFIARYCDEQWAVVDDLDSAKVNRYLDVQAMLQHLRDVGASGVT